MGRAMQYEPITGYPSKLEDGEVEGSTGSEVVSSALNAGFFVLGLGVLLPWSAMLSVLDFYSLLFPDISAAQYVTNAYMLSVLVTSVLLAVSHDISQYRRFVIFFGFGSLAVLSALLPLLVTNDKPIPSFPMAIRSRALWVTLLATATFGTLGGFIQSTIFGMLNLLPGGRCTTAFTAGGGTAGFVMAILRILVRIALDDDAETGPILSLRAGFQVFFLICTLICLACSAIFFLIDRFSSKYADFVKHRSVSLEQLEPQSYSEKLRSARLTMRDIIVPANSLLISCTVTMLIFPGLLIQLPMSLRADISPDRASWYPLFVVFLFAIGDTVGKALPSESLTHRYPNALGWLTLARAVSIPLYIAFWTDLFAIDWFFIIILVTIHGVFNGFITSSAFLAAPMQTSVERRESAGKLMFVVLIFGLALGSILGWLTEILLRSNSLLP